MAAAITILTIGVFVPSVAAHSRQNFHLEKTCESDILCTVTWSSLKVIKPGTQITYTFDDSDPWDGLAFPTITLKYGRSTGVCDDPRELRCRERDDPDIAADDPDPDPVGSHLHPRGHDRAGVGGSARRHPDQDGLPDGLPRFLPDAITAKVGTVVFYLENIPGTSSSRTEALRSTRCSPKRPMSPPTRRCPSRSMT